MMVVDLCVGWGKVGECDGGQFDAVLRELAAGEWTLAADTSGIDLQAGYELGDVDTIRLVDGRKILFAGFVSPVTEGAGAFDVWRDDTGEHFTLSGPDLWHIPQSRVAYPTPSTEPPWADSFDLRTGVASTVATEYLNANLGVSALPDRQYPNVDVIDRTAGFDGSWSARLQPLDQLIQRICREGTITCRLSIDYDGSLSVELVAARDRQSTTVLSDQGDLVNVHRRRTTERASYVIAGGQGALNARTFETAGTATGAGRLERFSDQAALATAAELLQSASATVAASGADWNITAELSTAALQRLEYGRDYDLGDTVAIEIENVRYPVPVTAVRITVTPERQTVVPILGNAAPDLLKGLVLDVANLQSRFDTNIA